MSEAWFGGWAAFQKIGVAGKSGHKGHAGRVGQRGGSAPRASFANLPPGWRMLKKKPGQRQALFGNTDLQVYELSGEVCYATGQGFPKTAESVEEAFAAVQELQGEVQGGDALLDQLYPDLQAFGVDAEAAEKWARRRYGKWEQGLGEEARGQLKDWADSGKYDEINKALRAGKGGFDAMNAALREKRLTKPLLAFRIVSDDFFESVVEMGHGAEFKDKGFCATSLTSEMGQGDRMFQIVLPKRTRGAFLNANLTAHPEELEFLLPKGTGFRILDIEPDLVTLEVMGQ